MSELTGVPFIDWFLQLLSVAGYIIVFFFTVFENLFVIGSFTPGETVVAAAALVASQDQLSLAGVWLSSFFGSILGSSISYGLGRRAGFEHVAALAARLSSTKIGRLLRISEDGLVDIQEHFAAEGVRTVLIARFAAGAKNFVPAVAGATKMPVFWFQLYTAIGAAIYTSLMCAIGWFLGENLDQAVRVLRNIGLVGLLVFLLFVYGAWYVRKRIKRRRMLASASNEPDPGDEQ
jgi:membrane protein DedA with SNARE-associated domain